MGIAKDRYSTNARGGTELMKFELERRLGSTLDPFQIFVSRIDETIDPDRIAIYWHQDLPNDPAAATALKENGWEKFDYLVFNSNWQMQMFNLHLGVPFDRAVTLDNAINPIPEHTKPEGINLCYYSTPHRGLELLYAAFVEINEQHPDVTLEVASSFKTYGWPEKDAHFKELFGKLEEHPAITYHGSMTNDGIREMIQRSHIFAYPNIWVETSCISLMEAMSGNLVCIHPNYGALPETSGGLTLQYQFNEDANKHASAFYMVAMKTIEQMKANRNTYANLLSLAKTSADFRFNWDSRETQWRSFLSGALNAPPRKKLGSTADTWVYRG